MWILDVAKINVRRIDKAWVVLVDYCELRNKAKGVIVRDGEQSYEVFRIRARKWEHIVVVDLNTDRDVFGCYCVAVHIRIPVGEKDG